MKNKGANIQGYFQEEIDHLQNVKRSTFKIPSFRKARTAFNILVYIFGAIAMIVSFWQIISQCIAVLALLFLAYFLISFRKL